MLSDRDIIKLLDTKELIIEPYTPNMLRATGVVMHLGDLLLKAAPGTVVDVRNRFVPDFQEIKISDEDPYLLHPGEFLLGHTHEKVTVGASIGLMIEGRSTLARVGLTIVQTAMLVYPGHTNRAITLELANHGPNPILLYPRMKIARVALFHLTSPATIKYDENGKYRNQEAVGKPIFEDEIL